MSEQKLIENLTATSQNSESLKGQSCPIETPTAILLTAEENVANQYENHNIMNPAAYIAALNSEINAVRSDITEQTTKEKTAYSKLLEEQSIRNNMEI